MASSGSNYGPTSQALVDRIKADHAALPKTPSAIPADMLTTSGSGLDPHISPANAQMQVNRVAQARSMAPAVLSRLVKAQTETPLLGFIGEPRVNVLALNRALDRINAQRQP
jgi:K+-transporting ATPase ATPase C chain